MSCIVEKRAPELSRKPTCYDLRPPHAAELKRYAANPAGRWSRSTSRIEPTIARV
jgi:hypothetical protein